VIYAQKTFTDNGLATNQGHDVPGVQEVQAMAAFGKLGL
jgi:hypothetical protein